jgi:hypothetical protein
MTFYLSGAGAYGIFLLYRMLTDSECSKTDRASWMVIAIASLFWIIVIPISILELQSKAKAQAKLDTIAKPLNFGTEVRHIKTILQVTEKPKENNAPQLNSGNS